MQTGHMYVYLYSYSTLPYFSSGHPLPHPGQICAWPHKLGQLRHKRLTKPLNAHERTETRIHGLDDTKENALRRIMRKRFDAM